MLNRLTLGAVLCCGLAGELCAQPSTAPSLDAILERFQARRCAALPVIITSKTIYYDHAGGSQRRIWRTAEQEARRDASGRVDYIMTDHYAADPSDGSGPETFTTRSIWDGERWSHDTTSDAVTRLIHVNKQKSSKTEFIAVADPAAAMDGVLEGDYDPIQDVLKTATQSSVEQVAAAGDAPAGILITAVTPSGKYRIWLDPDHDFNVARAEVDKKSGDIAFARKVPNIKFNFILDQVKFEQIGDLWFPTTGRCRVTQSAGTKTDYNEWIHERKKIQLSPDFEAIGAFKIDAPNGTPVNVNEFSAIPFIWKGGKIVPAVDEEVVHHIDRTMGDLQETTMPAPAYQLARPKNGGSGSSVVATSVRSTSNRSFGWRLMLAIVCVALFIVVILAYQLRKSARRSS